MIGPPAGLHEGLDPAHPGAWFLAANLPAFAVLLGAEAGRLDDRGQRVLPRPSDAWPLLLRPGQTLKQRDLAIDAEAVRHLGGLLEAGKLFLLTPEPVQRRLEAWKKRRPVASAGPAALRTPDAHERLVVSLLDPPAPPADGAAEEDLPANLVAALHDRWFLLRLFGSPAARFSPLLPEHPAAGGPPRRRAAACFGADLWPPASLDAWLENSQTQFSLQGTLLREMAAWELGPPPPATQPRAGRSKETEPERAEREAEAEAERVARRGERAAWAEDQLSAFAHACLGLGGSDAMERHWREELGRTVTPGFAAGLDAHLRRLDPEGSDARRLAIRRAAGLGWSLTALRRLLDRVAARRRDQGTAARLGRIEAWRSGNEYAGLGSLRSGPGPLEASGVDADPLGLKPRVEIAFRVASAVSAPRLPVKEAVAGEAEPTVGEGLYGILDELVIQRFDREHRDFWDWWRAACVEGFRGGVPPGLLAGDRATDPSLPGIAGCGPDRLWLLLLLQRMAFALRSVARLAGGFIRHLQPRLPEVENGTPDVGWWLMDQLHPAMLGLVRVDRDAFVTLGVALHNKRKTFERLRTGDTGLRDGAVDLEELQQFFFGPGPARRFAAQGHVMKLLQDCVATACWREHRGEDQERAHAGVIAAAGVFRLIWERRHGGPVDPLVRRTRAIAACLVPMEFSPEPATPPTVAAVLDALQPDRFGDAAGAHAIGLGRLARRLFLLKRPEVYDHWGAILGEPSLTPSPPTEARP